MIGAGGTATAEAVAHTIARARGGRHLLLLLDFDGTLCELAPDPDSVVMPPACDRALRMLAAHRHVTVGFVSGRSAADLRRRVPSLPGFYLAGCHGLEIDGPSGRLTQDVTAGVAAAQRVAQAAAAHLPGWPGVFVEDKALSIALHVRRAAPDVAAAAAAWFRETAAPAAAAGRLRILEGACVTELLPAVGWHKGRAVDWIRTRVEADHGPTFTLFAGDDVTDEDGFRAVGDCGLSVAVGPGAAGADVRLVGPGDLVGLLRLLAGEALR